MLVKAASIGIAAFGVHVAGSEQAANAGPTEAAGVDALDLSSLVGSDQSLNTKAMLEATPDSVLGSSGCINTAADTSGLFGWYAQPVIPAHPAFVAGERMGLDTAIGVNTIAVLSQTRVAVYELNVQGIPEFRVFTPSMPTSPVRQVAVSPDDQEIAVADMNGTVTFFRRSVLGWTNAPAAQILSSPLATLTGKALTYSTDGTQLFVEGISASQQVAAFQRNLAGDWEAVPLSLPGKLSPVSNRGVGWNSERLLVTDTNTVLVYKRSASGFDFSQALGVATEPNRINTFAGGFSVRFGGQNRFYTFEGTRFRELFTVPDLFDVAKIADTFPIFVGTPVSTGFDCASVRFINSAGRALGRYYLLTGFNQFGQTLVAGSWGVLATGSSTNGSEVYFIARDRIFGGQNAPIGSSGAGQGSFE